MRRGKARSGHLGIYISFNLHDHTIIIIMSMDVESEEAEF